MANTYISRAFISIDGVEYEADSATWKATKETEMKKPMNRQRRGRGRTRAVPDYELTMEFSIFENSDLLRTLVDLFQNEAEFKVVYELENGDIMRFTDSAINDLDQSNTEGEGSTITATLDAIHMDLDPAEAFA
jgi:hypothetical protein